MRRHRNPRRLCPLTSDSWLLAPDVGLKADPREEVVGRASARRGPCRCDRNASAWRPTHRRASRRSMRRHRNRRRLCPLTS